MYQADYIIVGQGLAGSCLALQLIMRNKRIVVIDNSYPHAASRVAAGLFNPVTGKTPGLTWMAAELFSYLHEFYPKAEQLLNTSFFHSMPVYRPFTGIAEQNDWTAKSTLPGFGPFVREVHTKPVFPDEVNNPYGGLELMQGGYLNTTVFLAAVRNLIRASGVFIEGHFNEHELHLEPNTLTYQHYRANRIVFCTGAQPINLFHFLTVQPLKGEVLTLRSSVQPRFIYNRSVYVVPGVWKAGATYNRHDKHAAVTHRAKAELEESLRRLIRFPYEVTGQDFGFRPTTPDRRPLLGCHPQYRNVYFFNGLGTKGVTLAPYFSKQMADFMEKGTAVNQQADIKRYLIR
jgi:glycine/D-amino acid oxidase-like deaminating enzyme